ncbi:vav isoform 1, partial [Danaus plexippus plexippus]
MSAVPRRARASLPVTRHTRSPSDPSARPRAAGGAPLAGLHGRPRLNHNTHTYREKPKHHHTGDGESDDYILLVEIPELITHQQRSRLSEPMAPVDTVNEYSL